MKRREFLKMAGYGIAATAMPVIASPSREDMAFKMPWEIPAGFDKGISLAEADEINEFSKEFESDLLHYIKEKPLSMHEFEERTTSYLEVLRENPEDCPFTHWNSIINYGGRQAVFWFKTKSGYETKRFVIDV